MKVKIAPPALPEATQIPVPLDGKIKDRFTELCKSIHSNVAKESRFVITLGEEASALFRAMDWRGMQLPDGVDIEGAKGFFMNNRNHVVRKSDLPELEELVVISPVSAGGLFFIADAILSLEVEE